MNIGQDLLLAISVPAGGLVVWLLGKALSAVYAAMSKNPQLAPLEPVAKAGEDAAEAAIKAAAADLGRGDTKDLLKDVGAAALGSVKADLQLIKTGIDNEIDQLADPNPTVTTPGNGVVNLPPRGFAPLVVILIIGGVAVVGGIVALVATKNEQQAISCVEQATQSNPDAVAGLVSDLSAFSQGQKVDLSAPVGGLEESLAKCVLTDLWDDTKAALARNVALKQNAVLVGTVNDIVAGAQAKSVALNIFPPGIVAPDGGAH